MARIREWIILDCKTTLGPDVHNASITGHQRQEDQDHQKGIGRIIPHVFTEYTFLNTPTIKDTLFHSQRTLLQKISPIVTIYRILTHNIIILFP